MYPVWYRTWTATIAKEAKLDTYYCRWKIQRKVCDSARYAHAGYRHLPPIILHSKIRRCWRRKMMRTFPPLTKCWSGAFALLCETQDWEAVAWRTWSSCLHALTHACRDVARNCRMGEMLASHVHKRCCSCHPGKISGISSTRLLPRTISNYAHTDILPQ